MSHREADIAQEIRRLLAARAPDASICPSDVARSLRAHESAWRALMPRVRDAARQMARDGLVEIAQRGLALDPEARFQGPVRLRRGPRFAAPE
jgi:hypothetical protein